MRRAAASFLQPSLLRSRRMSELAFILLPFLTGCSTSAPRPVIVQVNEPPAAAGRFRSNECQRDVWLAPQAVGNEILQHEQLITFVEKPSEWQLPSTIEPNAVSKPELPIQDGEYDETVLQRQRQLLESERQKAAQLESQLAQEKSEADLQLKTREEKIQALQTQQDATTLQLQQLTSQVESDRKARETEAALKQKKKWWQIW